MTDGPADQTLGLILLEIRGLRADLAARSKPGRNEAVANLLREITTYCGDAVFSARALTLHAQQSPSLKSAILAVVEILNARAVGRALQRWEGVPVDGLQVKRCGADSAGALWTIDRVP